MWLFEFLLSIAAEPVEPAKPTEAALKAAEATKAAEASYEEEIAELEDMREEVDEARKLAEEWESKYKEMQRQMSELETTRYKKHSLVMEAGFPMMSKKASGTSEPEMGKDLYSLSAVASIIIFM